MKKLILLIAFIGIASLYSQDSEPSAWNFTLDGNVGPFNPNNYQQTNMLTGFQWSSTLEMNNILMNNAFAMHHYTEVVANSRALPLMLINQPTYRDITGYNVGAWNAPFMRYEPTLGLYEWNKGTIMRPDDPQNPVFGFLNRKGIISQTPNDEDYSRLTLLRTDNSIVANDIVLNQIWPQPHFKTIEFKDFSGQTDSYLGRKWYLKINLKRLNTTDNNIWDNEVVLSIRMPIFDKEGNSLGYMRFDSLPSQTSTPMNYYENRGLIKTFLPNQQNSSTLNITRNMLPGSELNYASITIPAAFFTYDDADNGYYEFKSEKTNQIDSFDIEVRYNKNLDIAIDWISVESMNAHYMLIGSADFIPHDPNPERINNPDYRGFITLYTDPVPPQPPNKRPYEQLNATYQVIQTCYDGMREKSNQWQDARLLRFYYQDTESDKFYWWGPLRYCNMLSNGMFVTRDNHNFPEIYRHYTRAQNRWVGVLYKGDDALMPAPYCRNGEQDITTMGLKFGFRDNFNIHYYTHIADSLNSDYETYVDNLDYAKDDRYFNNIFAERTALQAAWERYLYESFYRPENKNYELLYTGQPWWMYALLYDVGLLSENIFCPYYRPKTAEELRLQLNSCLIRGAKGFLLDGDVDYTFEPPRATGQKRLVRHENLNSNSNLWDEELGGDFYNQGNDIWDAQNFIEPATISETMDIPENRIYFGPKSYRTEIFKFNRFIRDNDDLLMRLRLAASCSKGFRLWDNQDFNITGYNVLDKFTSVRNGGIFTRPIGREKDNKPYFEPWDSTFVDVSILREESDDLATSKKFYVYVLNRRTDPLVFHSTRLNFYSAAEFDQYVVTGGVPLHESTTQPKEWWQEMWWKRQGCREISITFNLGPENKNKLVRVIEMTKTKLSIQDQHRFNNTTLSDAEIVELYPSINTTTGYDGTITDKFLPAEAKLFQCEILDVDESLTGDLAHSNQNKMVVTPVYNAEGIPTEQVQYHLVYTKPITINSLERKRVIYNRSEPIDKTSPYTNIKWQTVQIAQPELLSQDADLKGYVVSWGQQNEQGQPLNLNVNCEYPSIVVRNENGQNIAYIVYQCDGESTNAFSGIYYSKINVNTPDPQTIPIPQPISIFNRRIETLSYGNENSAEYGNPVINASLNGNFIVWSTAIRNQTPPLPPLPPAIVVKYSPIGTNPPTYSGLEIQQPEFEDWYSPSTGFLKHPSVNVFSNNGVDECTLVWQTAYHDEDPFYTGNYNMSNKILYTKLKFENNTLQQYLPDFYSTLNDYAGRSLFNTNIMMLDKNSKADQSTFPVIYKKNNSVLGYEFIYCQKYNNWLEYCNLFEINNQLRLSEKHRIRSAYWWTNPCFQPNIAQSSGLEFDGFTEKPLGSYVLDFIIANDIYQMVNNGTIFGKSKSFTEQSIKLRNAEHGGSQPHLASSLIPNTDNYTWKNRRVFMNDDASNTILATGNYFYAYHEDDKTADNYIGFSADSSFFMHNLPLLDSVPVIYNRPYEKIMVGSDSVLMRIHADTLFTDWFEVNDDTLKIIQSSKDTSVKLYIVYQDNYKIELPCPNTVSRSVGFLMRYNLIMGSGNLFRLMVVNKDTNKKYNEEIIIDGLDVIDTVDLTFNLLRQQANSIPNLSSETNSIILEVTPIPAKDIVYVTARLPENISVIHETKELQIKLIAFDGKELLTVPASSGVTKSISLEKFA